MRVRADVAAGLVPLFAGLLLLCIAAPAWAQFKGKPVPRPAKKDPKWTFEVLAGGAFGPATPGGTAQGSFPPGTPFTTEAGLPSRTNPSWFFGDGAALFNEVARQFASTFNESIPSITTLDNTLGAPGTGRQAGVLFGARLARQLGPRMAVEFGFERSQTNLRLTDAATEALEKSRASFEAAFRGLLATVPQAGLQVTSTLDAAEVTTSQAAITGVLQVMLGGRGRLRPHATAGAGYITRSGGTLEARLRGAYQFRFLDTHPISEADAVTIRYRDAESSVVGVGGGGFTYDLSPRNGVRADVRVHVTGSGFTTEVDTAPSVTQGTPALALPSTTSPGIQFSNTASRPSSLGGATTGVQTFKADGLEVRTQLTVGFFFRF